MDKNYDHTKESDIYSLWEKSGAFAPKIDNSKTPFTIVMPPPNANDPLHIGHARFVAIEDILIRYHRMKGDPTLWLPGADHAGIETQYVFEKRLKAEGKSRFDYDHDTLYQMIWDYVQKNKSGMEEQLKVLGASCDWTRNKFTLDPDIVEVVYKTFKKLYDDGLIYRGERIVNFCPRCGTAYSQLEVDSVEREDELYYIDYGGIVVATTRPETIFADVAIAVNPKDKKYKDLVGKTAHIPLINREIPIIADELVDIAFGTGALKITPGHDATDFEVGQKHSLQIISVIDKRGKMIDVPEKYLGLRAIDARTMVVEDLEDEGKLVKREKIKHIVGTCYRDKGLIEPMLSKQWFLKVEPLTKLALNAIKKGEVKFPVKRFEKIAIHWLKNLRDWNISRQVVWGIKIPAWKCGDCDSWEITDGVIPEKCSKCDSEKLVQDTDTFDTWFSSSQWPFATLKATKEKDFDYFYPTSVMETAYDILPFWVIRMIMMGLYVTGKVPFKEVIIHGLVRDREGQKISKSKGNVIDPILMTQKYGSDALRMALIWGALIENDIALSEDNVRGQRNFANKLWNIARYIQMVYENTQVSFDKPTNLNKQDQELLGKLEVIIEKTTKSLDLYKLSIAVEDLYEFTWHDFADKYIESIKEKARSKDISTLYTLRHVYLNVLKLLHPFAPFVTETVWKEIRDLRKDSDQLLITSSWPKI